MGEGATPPATFPAVAAAAAAAAVVVVVVVAVGPAPAPPPAAPPPPLPLSSAMSPNPTGADGVSGVSSDAKNRENGDAWFRVLVVRWEKRVVDDVPRDRSFSLRASLHDDSR